MKYLAIDYGKRNIGIAISNTTGTVAMPFSIYKNVRGFEEKLEKILLENNIDEVVLGESLNLSGDRNLIQDKIDLLADFIKNLGYGVNFSSEVYSSMEAKWGVEKQVRRSYKKNKKKGKNNLIDDKAATMILRNFLESLKNK